MPSIYCPYSIYENTEDNDTNGTVLARHLIQSFLPGEVDPIKAHEIGMELCKKILKGRL